MTTDELKNFKKEKLILSTDIAVQLNRLVEKYKLNNAVIYINVEQISVTDTHSVNEKDLLVREVKINFINKL